MRPIESAPPIVWLVMVTRAARYQAGVHLACTVHSFGERAVLTQTVGRLDTSGGTYLLVFLCFRKTTARDHTDGATGFFLCFS